VPAVEKFQLAPWESSHLAWFSVSCLVSDLCWFESDVVVNLTLEEDYDLRLTVVRGYDVV